MPAGSIGVAAALAGAGDNPHRGREAAAREIGPMIKAKHLVALTACAALTAQAQDMPARKPGLWSLTMQMQGMPGGGTNTQQCVDAKSDAEMQRKAMAGDPRQRCTQKSLTRVAGGVEFQAECTSAEGKVSVRSRATGDFDKRYTVDSRMTFDPPQHGVNEATVKITAQHMGDCPAGMAPGQIRFAGGPGSAMGGAGGASGAGGRPGMPHGFDPKAMQGMSPEQLRQMAEEMKKATGR